MAERSKVDFDKRFGWDADDITVTGPDGKVKDISKKDDDEPTTGKDVNPTAPEDTHG